MWSSAQAINLSKKLLLVLIVLLPFHAVFVTVAISDNTPEVINHLFRSWKEILLVAIIAVSLPEFVRRKMWKNRIVQVVSIYELMHVVFAAVTWNGLSTMLGLRNNLGFLCLFVVGLTLAQRAKPEFRNKLENLIVWLGGVVALSVLLQIILPDQWFQFDLLGIEGDVSVIQDSSISRLHGILSGPLQLASYLVLPLMLGYKKIDGKLKYSYAAMLLLAIFLSYSRAGLLAIAAACLVLIANKYRYAITRKRLLIGLSASMVLLATTLYLATIFRPLSLIVFHAEPEKALSESSTVDHIEYSLEAGKEVIEDPLGDGPGTAGPASAFAENRLITENYFLQVGLEVGIIGAVLFIYISYMVAKGLYATKNITLLAVFAGLNVMNLFLHTWTDIATAWTFWLIAGVSLGLDGYYKHLE